MSDISTIYDLLDSAAKRYPIKALCDQVNLAESTLRGQLNRQPGHNLNLSTAINILKITGDLSALDAVEEMFERVAFPIPRPEAGDSIKNITALISALSKEFSEDLRQLACAMDDGKISVPEAEVCLKENMDLIKECLRLEMYLKALINRREHSAER